jgi:hypothetical protein
LAVRSTTGRSTVDTGLDRSDVQAGGGGALRGSSLKIWLALGGLKTEVERDVLRRFRVVGDGALFV